MWRVIWQILAGSVLLGTATNSFAHGTYICQPTVNTETKPCPSSHIQTFVVLTSRCTCTFNVTVHLSGGGTSIFSIKSGETKRDFVQACGPKKLEIESYDLQCA